MRILLDTHTFLWWDDDKLPIGVVERIRAADCVFVSAATAWEIAIKAALGKLVARAAVTTAIADYGFDELPIRIEHADAVRTLPAHHRDPFDRMLVAQALVEGLTIVSRDPLVAAYSAPVAWE
jgi:PIN domain nuclease of toxin-antitoxin system